MAKRAKANKKSTKKKAAPARKKRKTLKAAPKKAAKKTAKKKTVSRAAPKRKAAPKPAASAIPAAEPAPTPSWSPPGASTGRAARRGMLVGASHPGVAAARGAGAVQQQSLGPAALCGGAAEGRPSRCRCGSRRR